jgi:hypothetical protein
LAALAIAAVAIAAAIRTRLGAGEAEPDKFKAKRMLIANELEFLSRLEAAVPELRICPPVAMGAVLDPATHRSDRRAYFRQRGMFSQKIIDFVVQRRDDGSIVAIIELDDRTHDSAKDARRDAMLASAGHKITRWNSKAKPDDAAIRAALLPSPVAHPDERRELFLADEPPTAGFGTARRGEAASFASAPPAQCLHSTARRIRARSPCSTRRHARRWRPARSKPSAILRRSSTPTSPTRPACTRAWPTPARP